MFTIFPNSSPAGFLAPGMSNLGTYFQDMWKEAEADKEKSGRE